MKSIDIQEIIDANRSALNCLIALRRTMHTINQLEFPLIREKKLTLAQFGVLEILYNKGEMRIQTLIDKMLTTSGNMTVVIKNLERDGLVIRQCDPQDKRSYLIDLTDAGRQFIEEILPEHYQNIGHIFTVLEDAEKEQLVALLKKFKVLS
ncbi:MarR family winged helix-turn-helix transcriptional regulator [Streptococcus ovuberis]|uniref:MarR family transcriptional regulator n=1 Tax=Streptococcus ovuberis TaxID=1936207 RepID=A0A7X6S0T1_9STRE|nr:MarR family transcriptional regulator [Streptococcus ovuberis]NKZ20087.1 MarR family transcriptional regulator [Streptococcus ovuberis]